MPHAACCSLCSTSEQRVAAHESGGPGFFVPTQADCARLRLQVGRHSTEHQLPTMAVHGCFEKPPRDELHRATCRDSMQHTTDIMPRSFTRYKHAARHAKQTTCVCTTYHVQYTAYSITTLALVQHTTPSFVHRTVHNIQHTGADACLSDGCHLSLLERNRCAALRVIVAVLASVSQAWFVYRCTSVIALLAIRAAAVGGAHGAAGTGRCNSTTRCNMHHIATYHMLQRAGGGRALRRATTLHESRRGGPLAAGIAT